MHVHVICKSCLNLPMSRAKLATCCAIFGSTNNRLFSPSSAMMFQAETKDGKCSPTDVSLAIYVVICYKLEEVEISMNVRKEISRGLVSAGNCKGE